LPRLIWSEQALDELDQLSEYLVAHNPPAAEQYIEDIRLAVHKLAEFPEIGRRYNKRYRVLIVRNHLVFYRYSQARSEIVVTTVLDGRRNVKALLRQQTH